MSDESPDKKRKMEDFKRYPATDPYPHPKHKPQHKPKLAKDHDAHTKPDPTDESINHGVYEDRPRPAKINKRNLDIPIKNIILLFVMVSSIGLLISFIATVGCVQKQVVVSGPILSDAMSVYYVDVGQGDAEIIKSPSGKIMLIDAGDDKDGKKIMKYLDALNVTTIDTIVVSHPHADHIGGMTSILNKYKVNHFIESGAVTTTSLYENMLMTIDKKNISYRITQTNDEIDFDPELKMRVLNPSVYNKNLNDNSIVIKMQYRNVTFLFPGDIESEIESKMSNPGHIDILKVAHHGSDTSTSNYFVMLATPSVSIIHVGEDNKFNHPSSDVLARLSLFKSKIYRTDYNGTIIAITNGENYIISTDR